MNCTIWQAGRATSATGLAFKPIQIGQSVFLDEGAGKYNPAPQVLDEACVNEYPTRDVGVFLSIGTGRRPPGTNKKQSEWWEGFMGGSMGDFAEARRRLISKIEGCEETHQYMLREHLSRRGVNPEHYYRLNVEVGVGEFGMNEWSRLSDISTNTRRYLAKEDVQAMNLSAASKIARIHRAKLRWERANGAATPSSRPYSFDEGREEPNTHEAGNPFNPVAVELPAEIPAGYTNQQGMPPSEPASHYRPQYQQQYSHFQQRTTSDRLAYDEKIPVSAASDEFPTAINPNDTQNTLHRSSESYLKDSPPPLPPKTPIAHREGQFTYASPRQSPRQAPRMSSIGVANDSSNLRNHSSPSYPEPEGPPPPVSLRDKPQYGIRHIT